MRSGRRRVAGHSGCAKPSAKTPPATRAASTRSNLLLNHTPGIGFHLMEQKITSSTVQLPMGKCVICVLNVPHVCGVCSRAHASSC